MELGEKRIKNRPGETKEPSRGVFFQIRKHEKELVKKGENPKPAHSV
jgi:hypothetical protein